MTGKEDPPMLNTVLFDMGGTLEDIWNNQETQAKAMDAAVHRV